VNVLLSSNERREGNSIRWSAIFKPLYQITSRIWYPIQIFAFEKDLLKSEKLQKMMRLIKGLRGKLHKVKETIT